MHEVREFAGHSEIRTTEIYFIRKEEDGEVAARRIQIRLTGARANNQSGPEDVVGAEPSEGLQASGRHLGNWYD